MFVFYCWGLSSLNNKATNHSLCLHAGSQIGQLATPWGDLDRPNWLLSALARFQKLPADVRGRLGITTGRKLSR